MMTYNPPYYADLIEGWGFEKVRDMYAFRGHVDMVESLDEKMWFVIEESTRRFNIKLRPIDTSRFVEEVRLFLSIYNEANGNHWGFAPLTDGEIVKMAHGMKSLIVPELTSMAEVDGKTVGTIFGMLDYNPRIKQIDGRLFPTGFLKLLYGRRELKRARMLAAHVLPEFQRWGLGLVLANSVWQRVKNWGNRGGRVLLGHGMQQTFPGHTGTGQRPPPQYLPTVRLQHPTGVAAFCSFTPLAVVQGCDNEASAAVDRVAAGSPIRSKKTLPAPGDKTWSVDRCDQPRASR